MKKILTLTDFSPIADTAVESAFQYAQLYNAELHIYHDLTKYELINIKIGQEPKMSFITEKGIDVCEKIEFWNEWSERLEVDTNLIISSDSFFTKTQELVESLTPDLIIMGSNGASGKKEYIWGSNTQKVVQSIDCPVLVIKDAIDDFELDNFIFASSFDEEEQESFKYFINLIEPKENAHIHLVFIDTLGYFNQPSAAIYESMQKFKELAQEHKTSLHFYKDYSVDAGLRHIMEDIKPDMLVMTNKFGNPIKRFFNGSDVNRMINHSDYPVLIVDY